MREQWARRIALLSTQLVLLMAVVFAVMQNPLKSPDDVAGKEQAVITEHLQPVILDPQRVAAGQQIYQQQSCARCHSIADQGNPRNPLDGVGARHSAEQMRDWIIGDDVLQGILPDRAFKMKQGYKTLSDEDIDDLVSYMQSLHPESSAEMS